MFGKPGSVRCDQMFCKTPRTHINTQHLSWLQPAKKSYLTRTTVFHPNKPSHGLFTQVKNIILKAIKLQRNTMKNTIILKGSHKERRGRQMQPNFQQNSATSQEALSNGCNKTILPTPMHKTLKKKFKIQEPHQLNLNHFPPTKRSMGMKNRALHI